MPSYRMQDKDTRNLAPSDSMPVLNKMGGLHGMSQPPVPPTAQAISQRAPMPAPGPTPTPVTGGSRTSQGRQPPEEDDETFLDFLRNLACSATGYDEEEVEVIPHGQGRRR